MNTYKIKELNYYKSIIESIKRNDYNLTIGNTTILLQRLLCDLEQTQDNFKSCTDICPYSKLVFCSNSAICEYKCELLDKYYYLVLFDNENKKSFNECPYKALKEDIKKLIKTIEK